MTGSYKPLLRPLPYFKLTYTPRNSRVSFTCLLLIARLQIDPQTIAQCNTKPDISPALPTFPTYFAEDISEIRPHATTFVIQVSEHTLSLKLILFYMRVREMVVAFRYWD